VTEGAGIADLADGYLGQIIKLEPVRVVSQEPHRVAAVAVVDQRSRL